MVGRYPNAATTVGEVAGAAELQSRAGMCRRDRMVHGNGAASVTPQHEKPPRSRTWIPHVAVGRPHRDPFRLLDGGPLPVGAPSGATQRYGGGLGRQVGAVAFALIIIGVPLLLVLLLGHLIIGFVQWFRSRRHKSVPR